MTTSDMGYLFMLATVIVSCVPNFTLGTRWEPESFAPWFANASVLWLAGVVLFNA